MAKAPSSDKAGRRGAARPLSRHSVEAVRLLGHMIRTARIERKLTREDLAARIGASRDLVYRLERGDPRVSLGVSFEAATVVGVPLFTPEASRLAAERARVDEKLSLLPKTVRKPRTEPRDDF
jgi:transcriptional regulator with XRE-family HTH domain